MDTVAFGVPRRTVEDGRLIAQLAGIGENFDEPARELVCLLGASDDELQWLTFRASEWASGEVLAAGHFEDMLADLDVIAVKRITDRDDLVVTAYRDQRCVLEAISNGKEVGIVIGEPPAAVPRNGSADAFVLRALGLPASVPWSSLGRATQRVSLRRAGKVVGKPTIQRSTEKPPRVTTQMLARELAGNDWRERASERFFVKQAVRLTARPGKPLKMKLCIADEHEWPDLTGVVAITGTFTVSTMLQRGDDGATEGLKVIDLGPLREMIAPCRFEVTGSAEAVVAPNLERADHIEVTSWVKSVEFPRLVSAGEMTIGLYEWGDDDLRPALELPELASVKKLIIGIGWRPFVIRLPRLAKGKLEVWAYGRALEAGSVLEVPQLPRANIKLRDFADEDAAWTGLGLGARPAKKVAKAMPVKRAKAKKIVAKKRR